MLKVYDLVDHINDSIRSHVACESWVGHSYSNILNLIALPWILVRISAFIYQITLQVILFVTGFIRRSYKSKKSYVDYPLLY